VIRGHALRRDGTIRDTVMYSMRSRRMARGQGAAAVPAGPPARLSPKETAMLIDFFYTLRSAKLPVSVKEYLTLLEALKAGVVGPNTEQQTATRSTTSIT
jgi:hypothetical protein